MPNDVLTLYALCRELKSTLVGGKIDKVTQPESNELNLIVRNQKLNMRLVVSVRPDMPRIHLSNVKKESPLTAPNFTMQLRKHLLGAKINDVYIYNNDRIVRLDLTSRNEMMDEVSVSLLIELMGSRSNVILINKENKIITAIKLTGIDNCNRSIMPNITYLPPSTNNKISVFDLRAIDEVQGDILKKISGFSNQSLAEALRYGKLSDFVKKIVDGELSPTVVYDEKGTPIDYTPVYYDTMGGVRVNSLNEAMDIYYSNITTVTYLKDKSKHIRTVTQNALKRTEKKLANNLSTIQESKSADIYKLYGELITSYTYMIKTGMSEIEVLNYYTNENITIPLDALLSPQKNAQNYYKKYAKLKRSGENAEILYRENEQMIPLLKEILREIENVSNERDIEDIYTELSDLKLLPVKKKAHTTKKSKPISYEVDGYAIYVGKNAVQNNELTFETARDNDTWVHVLDYHGSHLIIRGDNPTDEVLKIACEIASYYSSSKGDRVAVDYTLVKHVKKNRTSKLGGVIYKHQRTLLVTPNKHEEYLK